MTPVWIAERPLVGFFTTPICKMTSVNQKKIQMVHWMTPLPINSWIVMSCINIVASLTLQKWALRSSDD